MRSPPCYRLEFLEATGLGALRALSVANFSAAGRLFMRRTLGSVLRLFADRPLKDEELCRPLQVVYVRQVQYFIDSQQLAARYSGLVFNGTAAFLMRSEAA